MAKTVFMSKIVTIIYLLKCVLLISDLLAPIFESKLCLHVVFVILRICKPGASMSVPPPPSRGQKALLRINKNYLLHM